MQSVLPCVLTLVSSCPVTLSTGLGPIWDPQATCSSSDISSSQASAAQKILLPELVLPGCAFPSPCTGQVPGLQEGKVSEWRCAL